MVGVNICRNLEDESCKFLFIWIDITLLGLGRTRGRGYLNKTVEQLLNSEIIQS